MKTVPFLLKDEDPQITLAMATFLVGVGYIEGRDVFLITGLGITIFKGANFKSRYKVV